MKERLSIQAKENYKNFYGINANMLNRDEYLERLKTKNFRKFNDLQRDDQNKIVADLIMNGQN
jgi:hypothetical protein